MCISNGKIKEIPKSQATPQKPQKTAGKMAYHTRKEGRVRSQHMKEMEKNLKEDSLDLEAGRGLVTFASSEL